MANPNPVDRTANLKPFKKGQSGNPGGKSKEQRQAEVKAAEDSAKLRALMTGELLKRAEAGENITSFIDAATLKLFKDSEDRGFGTPVQTVDQTSSDGSMSPNPTTIELVAPKVDDDSTD